MSSCWQFVPKYRWYDGQRHHARHDSAQEIEEATRIAAYSLNAAYNHHERNKDIISSTDIMRQGENLNEVPFNSTQFNKLQRTQVINTSMSVST